MKAFPDRTAYPVPKNEVRRHIKARETAQPYTGHGTYYMDLLSPETVKKLMEKKND